MEVLISRGGLEIRTCLFPVPLWKWQKRSELPLISKWCQITKVGAPETNQSTNQSANLRLSTGQQVIMAGLTESPPKQEDAVHYQIFPQVPVGMSPNQIIGYLEQLQERYLAQLSDYLVGYIWQNEPFRFRTSPGSTGECNENAYTYSIVSTAIK